MAASGPWQYLLTTVSFAVRTISGDYIGDVAEVATGPAGAVDGLVIARSGAFTGRTVVPVALVLGANAAERVVILNIGRADALKRLRRDAAASTEATIETATDAAHLLFLPTVGGYRLIVREGPTPTDAIIDFEDHRYRVTKIAHSPLPNDARCSLYLLAEL